MAEKKIKPFSHKVSKQGIYYLQRNLIMQYKRLLIERISQFRDSLRSEETETDSKDFFSTMISKDSETIAYINLLYPPQVLCDLRVFDRGEQGYEVGEGRYTVIIEDDVYNLDAEASFNKRVCERFDINDDDDIGTEIIFGILPKSAQNAVLKEIKGRGKYQDVPDLKKD